MPEDVGNLRIRLGLDGASFQNQMRSITAELRVLGSELREQASRTDGFSDTVQGLNSRVSNLNQQITAHRSRLETLNTQYEEAVRASGRFSAEALNLQARINGTRATINSLEGEVEQLNDRITQSGSIMNRFGINVQSVSNGLNQMGSTMKNVGAALTVAITLPLAYAAKEIVNVGAEFENAMAQVKAVSGASITEMGNLKDLAMKMGAETSFSAVEAANGIEELVKAGLSVEQVVNGGLSGALSLAAAGQLELASAAEIASTALNAFKKENLSVQQAADILAGAANASATSVEELKFGLSMSGAVAAAVGLSFKDTSNALALLANNGLKGSDAGTSLKTMMLNLQPTTSGQIEMFEKLNLVTEDGSSRFFTAEGKLKSFADIAGLMRNSMVNLTDAQRLQAMETMFGTDAIRASAIIFDAGAEGVKKMDAALSAIGADEVAKDRLDSLTGRWEAFTGSLDTAKIVIYDNISPALEVLVNALTKLANKFLELSPSTQFVIVGMALIAAAIPPLIVVFGALLIGVSSVITAFTAITAAMAAASVSFSVVIPVVIGIGAAAAAAGVAIVAATAVIVTNWDRVKEKMREVWQIIEPTWKKISETIREAIALIVQETEKVLGKISVFWSENGEDIMRAVNVIWDSIKSWISGQRELFDSEWPYFVAIIRSAWENIKILVDIGLNAIMAAIKITTALINGDWQAVWKAIKDFVVQTIKDIVDGIKSQLNAESMKVLGTDAIKGLIVGMSDMGNKVIAKAKELASYIPDIFKAQLGIRSPSTVMAMFGKNICEGLAGGISANSDLSTKEMKKMSDDMKKQFQSIEKTFYNEALKITTEHENSQTKIIDAATKERLEIEKKYQSDRKKLIDESNKLISDLEKTYNDALIAKTQSLYGFKGAFDAADPSNPASSSQISGAFGAVDTQFSTEKSRVESGGNSLNKSVEYTSKTLMDAVKNQVASVTKWQTDINELIRRGLNSSAIKELQDMGVGSAAKVKSLIAMTDTEIKAFSSELELVSKSAQIASGQQLKKNLEDQLNQFTRWQFDIQQLNRKGLDSGVVEELKQLGPKSAEQIQALSTLTEPELKEYSRMWKAKHALARTESISELQGLKNETDLKIKSIKDDTSKNLDGLELTFTESMRNVISNAEEDLFVLRVKFDEEIGSLVDGTKTVLNRMVTDSTAVGTDMMSGLIQSMNNKRNEVSDACKSITDMIASTMRASLQIQSPSRVMQEIGAYTIDGLSDGILGQRAKVISAMQKVSTDVKVNAPSQIQNQGVQSGNSINITISNLVGTNGMSELATIISSKISGKYGLSIGGAV